MAAISDWDFRGVENGFELYIAEIGNGTDDDVGDVLNTAFHDFGEIESLLYLRARNTQAQRDLVESLGLDWDPVYMPWLLVLEDHPNDVREGDKAIIFRLGHLDDAAAVEAVTTTLMAASREANALRTLTWEKRKERFRELMPVLRETADFVIAVVGVL
jgi:hypothetical protein